MACFHNFHHFEFGLHAGSIELWSNFDPTKKIEIMLGFTRFFNWIMYVYSYYCLWII